MNTSTQVASRQASTVENDPRWQAVLNRDASADGDFVYGVRTTGVYCRPSSSARRPRPENVEFFDSAEQAEAAGYRPSRRAAADQTASHQQQVALVTRACQLIEASDSLPSLTPLAEQLGLSPFHFHRVFKAHTGLTPKAYAAAHRAGRLRAQLARGSSVTDALYGAGFNASSRFYAASDAVLGMKPSDYRAGGSNTEIRFAIAQCSLGAILVAQSERGVCAILLGDDPEALARDLQDKFPRAHFIGGDADFEQLVAKVVGFVEAPAIGLDLPLDLRGTAFQERVWQALRTIPVGSTASYAEIAKMIGAPKSFRAVAQACGANSLAVAIPCHRVVRSDGDLSGYRWGVERKRQLLDREAQ
ncbi:DNA-O6-methylguanine--protein-cysteine S-methyltransferase /Transcriptional regulator Ada [Pseudomonas asplenii]|uniref:methylated-DNA--[protein]-cysteine S-methyltransferase n=1 Tax=Pseudomonas asplenii TaxID=53407 RepID=A0A0M9GD39_9PSED|nr:bifunctional DNA-binding transcriptional regulator/O6-methylguanine-DNA methyltransferase Ada [Pseudomonas fuscovaginae]KPA88031.1 DNA-O6-methylguanine--protein-cysteine S-methyltransferase /Transcriptional regulator Ada [Pseudomonas fuscovaginae]